MELQIVPVVSPIPDDKRLKRGDSIACCICKIREQDIIQSLLTIIFTEINIEAYLHQDLVKEVHNEHDQMLVLLYGFYSKLLHNKGKDNDLTIHSNHQVEEQFEI